MSEHVPGSAPFDLSSREPRPVGNSGTDRGVDRTLTQGGPGSVPPAPEAKPGASGFSLPGYEILGELGRGGMSVVYKARQVSLKRTVALKMILHAGHVGEQARERFRTEAEAVARLQHPNVVQVFEVGEHQGPEGAVPYFSLEYCAGGSLSEKVRGKPWEPAEAAKLVELLAHAMHAAHRHQIVHRDLKPANVLFAEDGTPKVTDFGLAKKLDEQSQTRTGDVMGTPSYMAPEQAAGDVDLIGPATDVWSLGAMLYELLTGRPPFVGATVMDTMWQVLHDEPVPPTRLQPRTPRDLETIALKCLEKYPNRRYPTMADLAEDLRRFQAQEPIRARPAGVMERTGKWVRRRPALAALFAVLLVGTAVMVVGSLWFALALKAQRDEIRAQRDEVRTQRDEAQRQRDEAQTQRGRAESNAVLAEQQRGRAEENARLAEKEKKLAEANAERAEANARRAEKNFEQAEMQRARAEANARLAEARFQKAREAVDRYFTEVSENTLLDEPGMEPLRQRLLEQAREFYAGFVEERRGDPTVRREFGKSLYRLALITGEIRSPKEALPLLREAGEVFAAQVRAQPGAAGPAADLASVEHHLGRLQRALSLLPEAAASYQQAIASWEKLRDKNPEDLKYQEELARSLLGLGNVHAQKGEYREALRLFEDSLKIRQQLVADQPESEPYRRDLAISWNNLGNTRAVQGRQEQALEAFGEAQKIQRALIAQRPERALYRDDLAQTLFSLGRRLYEAGDGVQALARYEEAAGIWEALRRERPAVPLFRKRRAEALDELATQADAVDKGERAAEARREAETLREGLVEDFQDVPAYQADLAQSYQDRAALRAGPARYTESRTDLGKALALLEKLTRDYPEESAYQRQQAKCLQSRGLASLRLGDDKEAGSDLFRALKVWEGSKERPQPYWSSQVGECSNNLGTLARRAGQWDDALGWFRKAQQAVEAAGTGPPAEDLLQVQIKAREGTARVYDLQGRYPDAVKLWDGLTEGADKTMRSWYRLYRLAALAGTDDYPEAVREGEKLIPAVARSADACYALARVFARAAGRDRDGADRHAARALELLRKAEALKQFEDPGHLREWKTDSAFDALRGRRDYRDWSAEVEKKRRPE